MAKNDSNPKNDNNPKGVGVKPSDIINQHKRMAMGLPT